MVDVYSVPTDPVLGDVDQDGQLEVVIPAQHGVHVYEHDGTHKWSNTRLNMANSGSSRATPLVVDVDGDGGMDVLLGSNSPLGGGAIEAWDGSTGALRLRFLTSNGVNRTGAVADLDNDGVLDLAWGIGNQMHVWRLAGDPSPAAWPRHHRDGLQTSAIPVCRDTIRTGSNTDSSHDNGTSFGSRLIAVRYTPTVSLGLSRIEVFTGGVSHASTLAVWDDVPGSVVRQQGFTIEPSVDWQGATFGTPVLLEAGKPVWIVWESVAGAQAPVDRNGLDALESRESFDGGATWAFPQGPLQFKVRLFGCSFLAGSNTGSGYDANSFAAPGVLAFEHIPDYDGTVSRAEVFTGNTTGAYRLELWREGTFGVPTTKLASAGFTMRADPSWQGVTFDPPVPVDEGVRYYVVWERRGDEIESYESTGPDDQVVLVRPLLSPTWAALAASKWKLRITGNGYMPPANPGPAFSTDTVAASDVAVRVEATQTTEIRRVELFTGGASGTAALAIWSHDPQAEEPMVQLGSGIFTMGFNAGWQGADLTPPVRVVTGKSYWLVWSPAPGSWEAQEPAGSDVQDYRESFDGGATWMQVERRAFKIRFLSCAGTIGCTTCYPP
jgi:hypothetical protein